jgi:hypothetical protein
MAGEHALIVEFNYGISELQPLYDLEDELEKAIDAAGAGEFDGHEIAVDLSRGRLSMYGPDAEALLAAALPLLRSSAILKGAQVLCRFGDAGDPAVRETRTTI